MFEVITMWVGCHLVRKSDVVLSSSWISYAKIHGEVRSGQSMNLKLPFLTNKQDLAPGDLLVMPFDGGMSEIWCESFPPIHTSEQLT